MIVEAGSMDKIGLGGGRNRPSGSRSQTPFHVVAGRMADKLDSETRRLRSFGSDAFLIGRHADEELRGGHVRSTTPLRLHVGPGGMLGTKSRR